MNKLFTTQQLSESIANCDKSILKIQERQETLILKNTLLNLSNKKYNKNELAIKNYENEIQIVKVEKLIYQTIGKGSSGIIFKKLFEKYSELIIKAYDLGEDMTQQEIISEKTYIDFCAESLKQREYIQKLCLVAEDYKKYAECL